MTSYVLLFDIDGCIADWSHRLHHIEITKIEGNQPIDIRPIMDPKPYADWDAFYAAMPDDPVLPGATIWNLLANQAAMIQKAVIAKALNIEYPVCDILTCRPEKMRAVTVDWLERNGLMLPRALHMRADDDNRPHHEIKLEMYRQHYAGKEEVLAFYDDNADTIAAFKALGITCYHVQ